MDWGMRAENPSLIEPGVQYFLRESLRQCHLTKATYYNTMYNFTLFVAFCAFFGVILWYRFKGQPSSEEWERKQLEKQKWILESIRKYKDRTQQERQALITGLPAWENEFDTVRRNHPTNDGIHRLIELR